MRGRSSRASSTRSTRDARQLSSSASRARSAATSASTPRSSTNDYTDIQLPTTVCALGASRSADAVREPEQRRRCGRLGRRGRSRVAYHGCVRDRRVVQHARLRVLAIDPGATDVTLSMVTPYTPENKASFGMQYEFTLVRRRHVHAAPRRQPTPDESTRAPSTRRRTSSTATRSSTRA